MFYGTFIRPLSAALYMKGKSSGASPTRRSATACKVTTNSSNNAGKTEEDHNTRLPTNALSKLLHRQRFTRRLFVSGKIVR